MHHRMGDLDAGGPTVRKDAPGLALEHRDQPRRRARVQAGAGIVADSNPAAEYEETRDKARALLTALAMAEAGLT